MMAGWTRGDTPSENGWYWVTVKRDGDAATYEKPLRYDGRWHPQVTDRIIAFTQITKPHPFSGIGDGTGYYIKTENELVGTDYLGWGLNRARWEEGRGYDSVDNAVVALKRYRKRQREKYSELYFSYSIVSGEDGSVVWTED